MSALRSERVDWKSSRNKAEQLVLAVSWLIAVAGCETASTAVEPPLPPLPAATPGGLFAEVTKASGMVVRHPLPTSDIRNIVESVGTGATFADLDGDGWLDIAVAGQQKVTLYRDLGNGRFRDVTSAWNLPAEASAVAVAAADVDGDGDRDLYLVARGRNRLFLNDGKGRLSERPDEAGDDRFGVGAVFFDMEGDGDLDLYVGNYLDFSEQRTPFYAPDAFPGPLAYAAEPDLLYANDGNGHFTDVSSNVSVAEPGRAMSVAAFDADQDGDQDLYVANDATENFLLRNKGSGRFEDEGLSMGLALSESGDATSSMAVDVGDVTGNGSIEIAVSDTAYGSLYTAMDPGLYRDAVMESGIASLSGQYVSWGLCLLDAENDGDLDIFIANGGLHHMVPWEPLLLANDGKGNFSDLSAAGGRYFQSRHMGRSAVAGDYDNDGDIDLLVTELSGGVALLRNDAAKGSWLTIDLVGREGRDPFGARVEVTAEGRKQTAIARSRTGYLGQGDPRLHFGFGPLVKRISRVEVVWPGGGKSVRENVETGRILTLREGAP